MATASAPSIDVLLRTAETLLFASAGGVAFTLIGFPAGLISGSLLGWRRWPCRASVAGSAAVSRVISVMVGISLGAVATPETLKGLAAFPLSIAVLMVATLCMTPEPPPTCGSSTDGTGIRRCSAQVRARLRR